MDELRDLVVTYDPGWCNYKMLLFLLSSWVGAGATKVLGSNQILDKSNDAVAVEAMVGKVVPTMKTMVIVRRLCRIFGKEMERKKTEWEKMAIRFHYNLYLARRV
ncbi:hypothetical protein CJ030_MR2G023476 [Morella rubra]|uniref:Uncharacterized protein n=1 Tax=Morella rubra TaxID=262757 RepID=A0A6A1WEW0_9ROSI|nr:hypothetical protein CJ030_MR2G023476 [Morella rubra]